MIDQRPARLALMALLAGALGIAFSPILVRLSELDPGATAFHRTFLALPVLWLWLAFESRGRGTDRRITRGDLGLLALAGLFFAGDLAFWHWSITMTSVANATLFANIAPIFVTLAAWRLFGERITLLFTASLALTLFGASAMVGSSIQFGAGHLWGDGFGVITAVFYAAYLVTVKQLRGSLSTATIMAYTTGFTALALLPVALIMGEGLIAVTWFGWAVLIAIALISQAAGQGLITFALAHLPASFTSVTLLSQPVAASLLAWLILAEPLGPLQATGGALVLAGILLARRASAAALRETAP